MRTQNTAGLSVKLCNVVQAFVESNRCIKWCPMPGCGRAVRLPETEQLPPRKASPPPTSHAVDCGNGHFFCW